MNTTHTPEERALARQARLSVIRQRMADAELAEQAAAEAKAKRARAAHRAQLKAAKAADKTPPVETVAPPPVTRFSDAIDSLVAAGRATRRDGVAYLPEGASFKTLPKAPERQVTTVVQVTWKKD